jgi:hypothetical protein
MGTSFSFGRALGFLVLWAGAAACTSTTTPGSSGTGAEGGEGASAGASASSGGATGTGGSTGSGGSGPGASLCEVYCTAVMTSCTGDFAQYPSAAACLGICGTLPPGAERSGPGNTVRCRLLQASQAAETREPAVHCPAAGPGGGGVCGVNCQGYCAAFLGVCEERFFSLFDGEPECLAACAKLPNTPDFSTNVQSGNSVGCRLYHTTAAAVAPDVHCSHAAGDVPCQ